MIEQTHRAKTSARFRARVAQRDFFRGLNPVLFGELIIDRSTVTEPGFAGRIPNKRIARHRGNGISFLYTWEPGARITIYAEQSSAFFRMIAYDPTRSTDARRAY